MVDLWKSKAGDHFIGIILLWLDENFSYHTCTLRVLPITVRHTAKNISDLVMGVLGEFFVVPSLFVADNASNQVLL